MGTQNPYNDHSVCYCKLVQMQKQRDLSFYIMNILLSLKALSIQKMDGTNLCNISNNEIILKQVYINLKYKAKLIILIMLFLMYT